MNKMLQAYGTYSYYWALWTEQWTTNGTFFFSYG